MAACSHCAADVPTGAKFCPECGRPAARRVCRSCGAPAETGKFCPECGTALDAAHAVSDVPSAAPVAERRVTSVLFGDLVGFTPLSESKDSEEVRELLSAYFQQCRVIVARYGGVIEKFIGDAVMAVWGVPVAHEDDAERAVRAGLELVAMVTALGDEVGAPGLAQRVGIVTGEVAVTVGATAEGMVAGDAVNTAARVQSAASPGQVWVDEATRALASAAITFDDTGEHELKGKAEPLRLWRAGVVVAERGGGQRVDGLEARFTGRDADLRLVKDLFHATQEARRPKLVVLDGEAGVGKSRLGWEFEKYVDGLTATARWHRGRCLSYGDGVAFWALAEAMRARFGLVENDTGPVVTDRLDAGLAEFVADASERDWLRPRLAVLLGAASGASFARADLFAAWTAFLERLADGESAVVLVLDDAQHADDGLLDFLDHLLATARAPVFVLALARPELLRRRPDLGGRRTSVVRLEPLTDEAMATLVDGLVADLPPTARTALVERAEGIPLFAVETVRALIDRDLVVPRDGRYVTANSTGLDLDAIGAPASLQALVAARLDSLNAEERRVVADAAVLGLTFTREGLLALGSTPRTLEAVLEALRRREILALQTDRFSAERGQFRFVQSVVRQVAISTMSRRDRKTRHLAAAHHLATEPDPADDLAAVIAQHLLDAIEAAPDTDPDIPDLTARALLHLERAATRAAAIGAPAKAQRLLEVALAHSREPAGRAHLHLSAAQAGNTAGHYPAARDHAAKAMTVFDDLGDEVQAGCAAAAQADAWMQAGDNAAAIAVAAPRWQALQGRRDADAALPRLATVLTRAHLRLSDYDAMGAYAERALLLAEGANDHEALATALLRIGTRYMSIGAPVAAKLTYEAAAEVAREHDLLDPLANSLVNLASLLNSRDLPGAINYAREAEEVARRSGSQEYIDLAMVNHFFALWCAGDITATTALLEAALDTATTPSVRAPLLAFEVWLADATGQPVPSRSEDHIDSTDDDFALVWQESADVARAYASGDPAHAGAIAADSFPRLLSYYGLDDDFCVLWPPLVLAALAANDLELASRLLEPVEEARPGQRSPAVAAQWHRLRGLVAARGGDPEFAETEMRAGITALEAFGAHGYRAQAQEELARWLADQHRPDDAAPLIDAARETYTEINATGWLARLHAWSTSRQPASGP